MTKGFWSRLVLPLAFLFGLSLLIHGTWPADGFFLNLATEIVGILITIPYVDWILKQHETQRWLGADARIANRLRILLNSTVSGIRDGLGFSPDILDERFPVSKNLSAMHNEIIRIAEHVISPIVYQRVRALDPRGWKSLATHVANSHNGTLIFLNAFQARLSPEQISDLLDLQEALSSSLTFYTVFRDLAGVPENQLPQTRTPPEMLQQSGYEATAKDIQTALALVKKLSQSITQDA
jgi:hypothetical protein